jgi:uncharacterized hydrophobic protein (TIGR00271 family)
VFSFEVFGRSESMGSVATLLEDTEGVRRVHVVDATRQDHSIVRAHIAPRSARAVLTGVRQLGIPEVDITVTRIDPVLWAQPRRAATVLEWADVVGTARVNARLSGLYLALMFIAGVIACYGVIDENGILIVGAMAISPDLLPIAAIGVGLVARSPVALRGLAALLLGMAAAVLASASFAFSQSQLDLLPAKFDLDDTVLGSLNTVNNETIVVALFAGAAGILALETRAMTAVGVAISVTTIPAAAYLGVAIGIGELSKAPGALGVLGMNVLMMSLGAAAALLVQRALQRHRAPIVPSGERPLPGRPGRKRAN